MRHISPAFAALAAILAILTCPRPALSQTISVSFAGKLSEPATSDGTVYCGSDTGLLLGVLASDGTSTPGFPVDVSKAVGDGSVLYWPGRGCRPSVYYGALGKAIYVETSRHGVVKVRSDGTIAWVNKLDSSSTYGGSASPAVIPNGEVIAEMRTSSNVFLAKVRDSDGSLIATSPGLGQSYFDSVSSPAIVANNIYLTTFYYPAAGFHKHVTVLDLADLTVKASLFGSASDVGPPFVRGAGIYFGSDDTSGATVFKLNSVTLNPDPIFGAGSNPATDPGVTRVLPFGSIGVSEVCASPTSADRDPGGTVYASVNYGYVTARVVAIDATNGNVRVLYDAYSVGGPGLVVSPKGVIAYGVDKALRLISVNGGTLKTYTLPGYPGRPCYDPTTNRFFVTTQPDNTGTSYLLGFDSP